MKNENATTGIMVPTTNTTRCDRSGAGPLNRLRIGDHARIR
jgi:hypothetical protein